MLQLESANVRVGARAESKEDAIRQVAELLVRSGCIEPGYAESMLAREQVANTYLGKGVAIPHGLPKDRELIQRTGIAVLQVPDGVLWQEGDTARLIVGIAARSDEHLDILSNLTGLLYDDELVDRLAFTPDAREVIAALTAPRVDAPASNEDGEPAEGGLAVEAVVGGAHGLHARPATAFVEAAKGFDAEVIVRHGTKRANGKSLAGLLRLGVKAGGRVRISARGARGRGRSRGAEAADRAGGGGGDRPRRPDARLVAARGRRHGAGAGRVAGPRDRAAAPAAPEPDRRRALRQGSGARAPAAGRGDRHGAGGAPGALSGGEGEVRSGRRRHLPRPRRVPGRSRSAGAGRTADRAGGERRLGLAGDDRCRGGFAGEAGRSAARRPRDRSARRRHARAAPAGRCDRGGAGIAGRSR